MTGATNEERALRGSRIIDQYIDMDGRDSRSAHEAAVDAVADILHAYCGLGDELAAESILRMAKNHFLAESDEIEREADQDGSDEVIRCSACGTCKEHVEINALVFGIIDPICCGS